MVKDSLGDRMKGYENVERRYLTRRMPTIIRVDGKAFHSFTRGFERPIDYLLAGAMWDTAKHLCEVVMGCKLAYCQSDEISLLLIDYDTIDTGSWFDKNILKLTSVSAAEATMAFNLAFCKRLELLGEGSPGLKTYLKRAGTAVFDSRVFNLPQDEVCNYFLWRQRDATRNAIQTLGQFHFSDSVIHKKSTSDLQEMLWSQKGINFNDCPVSQKRGVCAIKEFYEHNGAMRTRWAIDENIPIFSQERDYINKYVYVG